jgi:hypothetical protein
MVLKDEEESRLVWVALEASGVEVTVRSFTESAEISRTR